MNAENAMIHLRDAGVDVDGSLERMMNKPDFYLRMLGKFQQDTNFATLRAQMAAGEQQKAGEAAHALKGLCASLGMTALSERCAELQYICLGQKPGDPAPVFAEAEVLYAGIMETLATVLEN